MVQTVDEFGNPTEVESSKTNHFECRKKPYVFLTVFNLGKRPFDDTSIIEQVLPIQDNINKRKRQIDVNVDSINGGNIISGDHFTKEQAAEASELLRNGGTL